MFIYTTNGEDQKISEKEPKRFRSFYEVKEISNTKDILKIAKKFYNSGNLEEKLKIGSEYNKLIRIASIDADLPEAFLKECLLNTVLPKRK